MCLCVRGTKKVSELEREKHILGRKMDLRSVSL